ncbi:uncharacterized protein LOC133373989 [Rhineura floridana]|uniref:uncharacterized protein LOC133373989 n=1 Tax=Rhineura floridana TaxID=261503 RepID=UPI002AC8151E|nr:uncharacterized protein LOC133373989 [Rhineura floridana]
MVGFPVWLGRRRQRRSKTFNAPHCGDSNMASFFGLRLNSPCNMDPISNGTDTPEGLPPPTAACAPRYSHSMFCCPHHPTSHSTTITTTTPPTAPTPTLRLIPPPLLQFLRPPTPPLVPPAAAAPPATPTPPLIPPPHLLPPLPLIPPLLHCLPPPTSRSPRCRYHHTCCCPPAPPRLSKRGMQLNVPSVALPLLLAWRSIRLSLALSSAQTAGSTLHLQTGLLVAEEEIVG